MLRHFNGLFLNNSALAHTHTHARTHSHEHIHTHTHTHTHTRAHTHTDARTHARTHARTLTHTQTHARTHTNAHTNARTQARTRTHTHTQVMFKETNVIFHTILIWEPLESLCFYSPMCTHAYFTRLEILSSGWLFEAGFFLPHPPSLPPRPICHRVAKGSELSTPNKSIRRASAPGAVLITVGS